MKEKRFVSIKVKLLLAFLVVSLVPLLIIGFSGSSNVRNMGSSMVEKVSQQLTDKTKNMLSNSAQTSAEKVEALINQYKNDVQMLSQHSSNTELLAARISDPNWTKSSAKASLDNFYRSVQLSRPEMSNVRLFFKDGYAVSRLRGGNNSLIDTQTGKVDFKGDKIWFKLTMDKTQVLDKSIYVSAVNIARNNNKPEIRYTVPINVGSGREGLIIVNYSAKAITESLTTSQIGKEGYAFMVDKNYETAEGKAISGGFYLSHPEYEICNESEPGTIIDNNSLKGNTGYVTFRDHSKQWTAAYRKVQIPGREWYVVAAIPTAEMMQSVSTVNSGVSSSVNQLDQNFMILTLLSILFVLAAAMIFSTQITRPVRKLTEIAEKVSTGSTDVEVNISSNDELGALAQAFNRMVVSIKFLMNEDIDKTA
jgi:methyl-accepting chemotaxis protein